MTLNNILKNKSFTVIIIGLILFVTGCKTIPVLVKESSTIREDSYVNEKYGFTLDLPKDFTEDVSFYC